MNFMVIGIIVKEKDVALICDQNEFPYYKGSWEIEKNGCHLLSSYRCSASWKGAVADAAIAALRQE